MVKKTSWLYSLSPSTFRAEPAPPLSPPPTPPPQSPLAAKSTPKKPAATSRALNGSPRSSNPVTPTAKTPQSQAKQKSSTQQQPKHQQQTPKTPLSNCVQGLPSERSPPSLNQTSTTRQSAQVAKQSPPATKQPSPTPKQSPPTPKQSPPTFKQSPPSSKQPTTPNQTPKSALKSHRQSSPAVKQSPRVTKSITLVRQDFNGRLESCSLQSNGARKLKMERLLIINAGENLDDKLFRVAKHTVLTIQPGATCMAQAVSLSTNYPLAGDEHCSRSTTASLNGCGAQFSRHVYYDLPVSVDHQDLMSSLMNWHVSVELKLAGTFHFVCRLRDGQIFWRAHVVVEPELKVPLDAIRCQTVLTKNLGPLSEWRQRLTATHNAKYNVIHFTPIQELGASQSAYSLRNQHKVNPNIQASLDDIKKEVDFMDKKWNILSMTDIVLNHTAHDTEWIREHSDCAYNLSNSPHLRPAFLLDTAMLWLAQDMANGLLKPTVDLSALIKGERDVLTIGVMLRTFYVAQLKIYELYMIDVAHAVANYGSLKRSDSLCIDYGQYKRNSAHVVAIPHCWDQLSKLEAGLKEENLSKRAQIKSMLDSAIDNALNTIRYERLNPAGPHFGAPVSAERPLVGQYFNHTPMMELRPAQEESLMYSQGHLFMANNGWVMGSSAGCDDFASSNSWVYLKRELIVWGDCIKLRYGSKPSDAPYLWEHMRKYVESQAKIFHGFRLDNCHSTPLHVAEFVVDCARSIRPDIYIMAELFTSSESLDNAYVSRLGITALIRESMSAHNSRELGRLIYRFGGEPVGAFYALQGAQVLKPAVARAIFYDQTHDNDSIVAKRCAYDAAPSAALLSMANCATGSSRGFDELVPHHINVVTESRPYPLQVDDNAGLVPLRRLLNGQLQRELQQGFSEIFVDQRNDDVIAITRHNPVDGRSIVLVARTAFSDRPGPCSMRPLPVQGRVSRVLFESQCYGDPNRFERDEHYINGLAAFKTKIFTTMGAPSDAKLAQVVPVGDEDRVEVLFNEFQFLPSSVMAFEVVLSERQSSALAYLNEWRVELNQYDLTLSDANYILFRCPQEDGQDSYALPGLGSLTYNGLYGLMYHLERVRANQDQAHPLTMNLRQGRWLSDYIVHRLRQRRSTAKLAEHLGAALDQVDLLPRGMVPKYFDLTVTKLYTSLVEDLVYDSMSPFVSKGPRLVKLLALSSVALIGHSKSAPLPDDGLPLPASVPGKGSPAATDLANQPEHNSYSRDCPPSIAAGLPHFSSGAMRNWGRDTFIAMRGLMLITGRFAEARGLILAFARTLQHGLIPNLLDGGLKSRYNSRDAVWWWLYSICQYAKMAPHGGDIFRCRVRRLYRPKPSCRTLNQQSRRRSTNVQSSSSGYPDENVQSLADIIQESLEIHFRGLQFFENEGRQLDDHMKQEGFSIGIGIRNDTGFVYGGNQHNCGTWMDKMGSSEKAGNKGKPASPRDGSAVELVGLCKAVVSSLDELFRNGRQYPYDGVECLYDDTITIKCTWKKWSTLIQNNFERHFYIPRDGETPHPNIVEPRPDLINRRGIYKDSVGASIVWQDYQLRPNFLVAMVVAPELFDREHARHALQTAKTHLCGPQGMRTLDPSDWNYCGDYVNSNDSEDPKLAHGFNYHQGPEWLWLTGYYIRASAKFAGPEERAHHLQLLAGFYGCLTETPWLGLPELTNTNGMPCADSCPIQAWSLGTAMEALYESVRG